ncbi:MAG: transposase [Verrucomicrobia bacterium]|nr:transposase [Verrucomicrobiota bacterium]
MARKARVEYEGACYHVINRGNFRQNIFTEPGAAESYEKVLFEAVEKYGWKLSAYVIMSNHFHLALELTEPNFSLGMKWLQGTWVRKQVEAYLSRSKV